MNSWAFPCCSREISQKGERISIAGIALYDPAEHRPLTTRFGEDHGVGSLVFRSWALWLLRYPEAALADAQNAVRNARAIGQAGSLMQTLVITASPLIHCGNYVAANAQLDEVAALADEKGAALWKADTNDEPRSGYLP